MSKKILVIEDTKLMKKILELNLQRLGYTVYIAQNGRQGLNIAFDT